MRNEELAQEGSEIGRSPSLTERRPGEKWFGKN